MKLSVHWKDKVLVREQLNRHDKGLPPKGKGATFVVKWDHPDHPKGERTEEKHFVTLDEAKEYGVWVAKNFDLRREGATADSPGIKNGYNPIPEPSSTVPVAIETPFGLLELTELDVFGKDAKSWTLVDALVEDGHLEKVEDNFRKG